MPWKIRQIPIPLWQPEEPTPGGGTVRRRARPDGVPLQVGDAWYEPERIALPEGGSEESWYHNQLSRHYDATWRAKRCPIVVILPDLPNAYGPRIYWFCVDWAYHGDPNPQRNGWIVTGSLEDGDLTLTPSVNLVGSYHGFIKNGVIGDDVEGRTYAQARR